MGILQKISALWKARKVVNQMGEIKRGWKTPGFWLALLGNIIALLGALKGAIPAMAALVAMTTVTALYNILRGAQKSEEAGVRAWWKTTEFWMGIGTEASKAFLALQAGGIDPKWMATLSTVLAGVMAIARDLSHKQPS